jgi:AcrR family transcriptional regulator
MSVTGRAERARESTRKRTRAALVRAARDEFETRGYAGTNTNLIARAAGYAPQTFYRHFADKRTIFLAVYETWAEEEIGAVSSAMSADELASFLLEHHRRHKVFRRALRQLSIEDEYVAEARARSRRAQIEALRRGHPSLSALPFEEIAALLLTMEKLCDAYADGELEMLGIADAEARALIARRILGMSV